MKKLVAWVLFFVLIFGCIHFITWITDQDETRELIASIQEKVDQKTADLKTEKEKPVKEIDVKDTQSAVKATFYNEYAQKWTMTHRDYENFTLEMPNHQGGYIAGDGRKLFDMTIGKDDYKSVAKKYGKPLDYIQKGMTQYGFNEKDEKEMLWYSIDGYFVTFFFDNHQKDQLRAIQYIQNDVEMKKDGYYGQPSEKLKVSFEKMMVELMNQSRVEHGLKPFKYDAGLTAQARAHSEDMVKNKYFSHTGSDGSTVDTRMKAAGYKYEQYYAENLAFGQYSSIFAHEGLMNSLGHRENILNKNLQVAGVGVAFDSERRPYYTINFYTSF